MDPIYACGTYSHMSSRDIMRTLGWSGSGPYRRTKVTTNKQGNVLCNFIDLFEREGFQYQNSNGSYYFRDTDGSSYYNSGTGYARYNFPKKTKMVEIFNSRLRSQDFDPQALNLDFYRAEFPELREDDADKKDKGKGEKEKEPAVNGRGRKAN